MPTRKSAPASMPPRARKKAPIAEAVLASAPGPVSEHAARDAKIVALKDGTRAYTQAVIGVLGDLKARPLVEKINNLHSAALLEL